MCVNAAQPYVHPAPSKLYGSKVEMHGSHGLHGAHLGSAVPDSGLQAGSHGLGGALASI